MNPILESISNSISAMPVAPCVAQPASGQSGTGGFASALAAAQAQAAAPRNAASEGEGRGIDKSVAGAPSSVSVPVPASGNPPAKKSLSSASNGTVTGSLSALYAAAATAAVITQAVVPGSNPTTLSQIPSLQQPPGLLQPTLPPVVTGPVQVQTSEVVPGAFQLNLPAGALGATSRSGALSYSASSQIVASQVSNQSVPTQSVPTQSGSTQISPNGSTPDLSALNLIGVSGRAPIQTAPNQTALSPTAGSNGSLTAAEKTLSSPASPVAQNSRIPNAGAPASAQPAENAQPSSTSATFGQSASNTPAPTVAQVSQGSITVANLAAFKTAETTLSSEQTVEPAPAAETLVATSNPGTGAASGEIPFSDAKLQVSDAGGARVGTPDAPVQTGLPAQTDLPSRSDLPPQGTSGSSLVEIMNGQILAPAVPTSPALGTLEKAAPQVPAAKVAAAITNPTAHGMGQTTEAPSAPNSNSSSTSPALTAGAEPGSDSKVASQTPFSIFFSSPGPGSESAASTLPKVILPVAGSAIRGSHATGTEAPSANPQTVSSPSGIRQSPALPNTKDALSGTETGASQNPQLVRAESDLSAAAASVPAASPQTVAVPVLTPATPAVATVPASAPPALPDGPPPPTPLPSSGSPATAVPAPLGPAVLGTVQVAQLVNRLGQSEMRIALNTSAFGSVEVRTTVRTSDVGLVIGSEKGDLRTLLANEMPAIANTLQQQNLRLNSVNFMQGFAFSNNASGGGDSQQRSFVPTRGMADSAPSEAMPDDSADPPPASGWGGGSISILA